MDILKAEMVKGSMKKESAKANAPVAKPEHALEHLDGGGMQHSTHPTKNQTRVMRFIKR